MVVCFSKRATTSSTEGSKRKADALQNNSPTNVPNVDGTDNAVAPETQRLVSTGASSSASPNSCADASGSGATGDLQPSKKARRRSPGAVLPSLPTIALPDIDREASNTVGVGGGGQLVSDVVNVGAANDSTGSKARS